MDSKLRTMLVMRHYLVSGTPETDENRRAYFNAYLLSNFGIVVDRPNELNEEMLKDISTVYKLDVPDSFYSNPQDTKYYTRGELLVEQLVSYFLVETGTGIYSRPEIFDKDLPEYKVGNEIKLRNFNIVTEEVANELLTGVAKSLCDYTRPFGLEEAEDFKTLFKNGYVDHTWDINCKDNIFNLLKEDINFASFLDKKDLVKLSIKIVGERPDNLINALVEADTDKLIQRCLPLVRNCPMTKKQAKYYNKLVSTYRNVISVKPVKANSPYKTAMAYLHNGEVMEAAKVFAKSGSLLQRNLRMLLSRANPSEMNQIIDMIPAKNPIVLYQLVQSLKEEAGKPRTFTFTTNNKVKKHVETDYETMWRKSRLNSGTVKFLHDACLNKIYSYYESLPQLGDIYINDSFYKIGLPTNTSASGKGIDVLPTGSRLLCKGKAIRTFVTWKKAWDIDASLTLIREDGRTEYLSFCNYSSKPYGDDVLFSGDDRGYSGTEYYDIKLDEMKAKGFKYIIQSFHGFASRLNEGEIYCGFQNKDDLNTKAWDSKNVETQFRVNGDSRACLGLAIDLDTKEIVILNLMVDDESRVVNKGDLHAITKYLEPDFLDINIGAIVEHMGVKVDRPEAAHIVLDDTYVCDEALSDGTPVQEVVRSWEIEKLVSLINRK